MKLITSILAAILAVSPILATAQDFTPRSPVQTQPQQQEVDWHPLGKFGNGLFEAFIDKNPETLLINQHNIRFVDVILAFNAPQFVNGQYFNVRKTTYAVDCMYKQSSIFKFANYDTNTKAWVYTSNVLEADFKSPTPNTLNSNIVDTVCATPVHRFKRF